MRLIASARVESSPFAAGVRPCRASGVLALMARLRGVKADVEDDVVLLHRLGQRLRSESAARSEGRASSWHLWE